MLLSTHLTVASLLALLVSFPETAVTAEDAVVRKFGDWTVTIQPGPRGSGARDWVASPQKGEIRLVSQTETESVDVPPSPVAADPQAMVLRYSQVYDRIPFSRAEYEANPSYRHDATMEFLFGRMRTTIVQRGPIVRQSAPAMPAYYPPAYSPYGFNSYYYPFYNGYQGYGYLQPASLW